MFLLICLSGWTHVAALSLVVFLPSGWSAVTALGLLLAPPSLAAPRGRTYSQLVTLDLVSAAVWLQRKKDRKREKPLQTLTCEVASCFMNMRQPSDASQWRSTGSCSASALHAPLAACSHAAKELSKHSHIHKYAKHKWRRLVYCSSYTLMKH